MDISDDMLPICSGKLPDIELVPSEIMVSADRCANVEGKVPVMEFDSRARFPRKLKLPREGGIVPVRLQ